VFVYSHDLLDCVEIHGHTFGVDGGCIFLRHHAVTARHADERDELAEDVVEDNFLIALVVEKVCLYLFMTKCQTEMFLEALFDLRAQLVYVDLIHVFMHEIHDLRELVVSTPSVLA
jgi:hypothetical protein